MTITSRIEGRVLHRKPRQQRKPRLQVEELEDRSLPSGFFPSTSDGIHVFEDQLPNLSDAMVQFLATHVDGTQKQTLNQINALRAINPNFTLLHYQLGTSNSPFDYILNNQWSNDWAFVNQHEDWFAHQTYSGEPQSTADLASGRVGNATGLNQADIANPAWQTYTLEQVLQNMAATQSNGWFADSFTFGLGGAGYDRAIPDRYTGTNAANPNAWPGGVTWTDQLGSWARVIESAFAEYNAAHGTEYKFLPNLDARVTSWEPDWYNDAQGVPVVDGAFLEGFGQWTDSYDWALSMNRGLKLTGNDKIVIMQPYLSDTPDSPTGQQERGFYLGTYLLLKGDRSYLNMVADGDAQYFPEYQLKLGPATTPLPSDVAGYLWNGVYRRDFENGFVLVNPGSTDYTLDLGGTFQQVQGHGGGNLDDSQIDANNNYIGGTLSYQDVSSVTLAGGTAVVLLRTNPTQPDARLTALAENVSGVGGVVNGSVAHGNPVSATGLNASDTLKATATTSDPSSGQLPITGAAKPTVDMRAFQFLWPQLDLPSTTGDSAWPSSPTATGDNALELHCPFDVLSQQTQVGPRSG